MISRLFILWRTPDDSRRRFVIGELWRDNGTFFFAYRDDISEAEKHGFTPLVEFPEHRGVARPYTSSGYLFSTFAQRIPSPRRPDYMALMDQWQVEHRDDPFEVLARSGGVLATDGIELAEYRTDDDPLTTPLRIRVAGLRYYPGRSTAQEDARVDLVLDPGNAHDKDAVKVMLPDGAQLGYVPHCYAPLIHGHLARGAPIEAMLRKPLTLADDPKRWQLEVRRVA